MAIIKNKVKKPADLFLLKRLFAKKYQLALPKNSVLLSAYHKLRKQEKIRENKDLERLLRLRKVRSLSGIVSISVLTKPFPCPGKCLYCPIQKNLPKSYLDGEPAVMRALANDFNPYRQVQARLEALQATGHDVSKIELIIIGGTWSFLKTKYQNWFIKECFRAANDFGISRKTSLCLTNAMAMVLRNEQKRNEGARNRIIGITIETRPDYITKTEIRKLRRLGVTRVELGTQCLDDKILKKNRRGHGIDKTVLATKLLRNAGFKICYHVMPNLPGADLRKDENMFKELFRNPDFKPDFLKIYPCVVVKEAPLYQLWLKKQYQPYSNKQLISLLAKAKQQAPFYCRIIRIYRDIPSPKIIAGSKISNLRQVLAQELKKQKKQCRCIRCREVKGEFSPHDRLKVFCQEYSAAQGKEIFLSFEDKKRKKLFALLRLRLANADPSFPVLKNAALIRELHTYGEATGFKQKLETSPQHRSFGKELMGIAEKISRERGFKKIAVIAGVGSRNYYRKLGYRLKDSYLVKNLS